MENTSENTAVQMIEIKEMDMGADMERVTERIITMPIEKNESPIEVPTSPVNEEGDNEEHSFATECHGTKCRHPTEVLDAKVKKPQFRQWYVKYIFGNKISPGMAAGAALSKLNAFLLMFPPK